MHDDAPRYLVLDARPARAEHPARTVARASHPTTGGVDGQEDPDAGRRLRRGLRGHGAVPDAADGRPPGRRGLPRQEGGRDDRAPRSTTSRATRPTARNAGTTSRSTPTFDEVDPSRLRRPGDPRRPRAGVPAARTSGCSRSCATSPSAASRSPRSATARRSGRGRRAEGPPVLGLPGGRPGRDAGGRRPTPAIAFDEAHVDGKLVTAPAWPAHPAWLARS